MWKKFKQKIKDLGFKGILLMNLGCLCCAISTVIFISPSKLISGGTTGLSIFLEMITNVDYYIFLYGINILLIIVAFFTLGSEFAIKTIFGSLMLPTYGALVKEFCGWINFSPEEAIKNIEPIFVVLFSSLLMGFGIGVNMKQGGSTGGFDILESIGLKYFRIPYSTSMYILDAILIVLGMSFFTPVENGVFESGLSEGLGAVIYVFVVGVVVDAITFGGYNKRAVFIRSSKYEEIHDEIITKLVRGLTYLNAEGGYSHTPTKMIVCICYSREYFFLRDIVSKIDPNAFIFVTKATEVRGLGFNFETPEHLERRKKRKMN